MPATDLANITIQHRVWVPNNTRDAHGNDQGGLSDPIDRSVIAVYPLHWQRPKDDPITVDELARTETDIMIDVPDPSVYKKLDTVLINGISFEIQGQPMFNDWSDYMPFSEYDDMFGGSIHARRVT